MHKKVDQRIEELKDNLIESTQEIIRIKSVRDKAVEEMPFGIGINDALERFLQIATAMGLKTRNLDGYAGYVEIGEGEELLGVLCHLDVVPEGSNWTYPPYNAEIVDGKIYGRGSIDNKGPALASLYALKALQDSEIKLNKRVRLILGTDEESDWQGIKYYLENEEIPDIAFSPDAEFPVIHGEKGILHFKLAKEFKGNKENSNNPEENSKSKVKKKQIKFIEIKGGNAPNMVPDFCQALLESNSQEYIADEVYQYNDNNKSANLDINYQDEKIVIASHGVSAHGSLPEDGINAISHLLIFLGEIEFSEDINDFLKFYQQKIGLDYNGKGMGYSAEGDPANLLTFNVGQIKVDSEKAEIIVDIRYPVSLSKEEVEEKIKKMISGFNISYQELGYKGSLYVEKNDPLVEKLMKVYLEYTKEIAEPIIIGGGTYARAIDKAVAFGPIFPGQEELAHQKDEYIAIDDLLLISKIYAGAIVELAGK